MQQLWAPWRIEYIQNIRKKKEKGCIFCLYPKRKDQSKVLILAQTPLSFVILNKFPYSNGHLMVVPKRHVSQLEELSSEEGLDLFLVKQKVVEILRKVFKPEGFNLGMNVGKAAGAGIEKHLHTHIVPRWFGDTNFMPILTHSKVISEGLDKTYKKLSPYFKK
ncbi:MAG: HIT domain-containing protein [Deltaproteobacteria bacterium]|nr:HIT domain-containing protein [Deltaproteobacteria bacterium]MBI3016431.1 HIT domain-containing protein [Deltaproteobacteria bacterium]